MSNIPRSVNIAGRKLKVRFIDGMSEHGVYDHDRKEIVLRGEYKEGSDGWPTLWHEMIHASLNLGGVSFAMDDATEEAVVRNLEQLFLPAFLETLKRAL